MESDKGLIEEISSQTLQNSSVMQFGRQFTVFLALPSSKERSMTTYLARGLPKFKLILHFSRNAKRKRGSTNIFQMLFQRWLCGFYCGEEVRQIVSL